MRQDGDRRARRPESIDENSMIMAMLRFVQTCVQVAYCFVCTRLHLCNRQYIPFAF